MKREMERRSLKINTIQIMIRPQGRIKKNVIHTLREFQKILNICNAENITTHFPRKKFLRAIGIIKFTKNPSINRGDRFVNVCMKERIIKTRNSNKIRWWLIRGNWPFCTRLESGTISAMEILYHVREANGNKLVWTPSRFSERHKTWTTVTDTFNTYKENGRSESPQTSRPKLTKTDCVFLLTRKFLQTVICLLRSSKIYQNTSFLKWKSKKCGTWRHKMLWLGPWVRLENIDRLIKVIPDCHKEIENIVLKSTACNIGRILSM